MELDTLQLYNLGVMMVIIVLVLPCSLSEHSIAAHESHSPQQILRTVKMED